ncbi:hypothetical protein AB1N83_011900 [Pleurotus pulmonarius]
MPSTLDLNLGAMLIGALLGSVLFGVVTVQVYVYFQSSFNDTKQTRLLVIVTWIIECVWTTSTWIYLYHIIVTHYGDMKVLKLSHWALVFTPITSGAVETIVQVWSYNLIKLVFHYLPFLNHWQLLGLFCIPHMGPV